MSGFREAVSTRNCRKKSNNSESGQNWKIFFFGVDLLYENTSVCRISCMYIVRIKSYEKWAQNLDDLDLDICSRSKVTEDIVLGFVSLRQMVYE